MQEEAVAEKPMTEIMVLVQEVKMLCSPQRQGAAASLLLGCQDEQATAAWGWAAPALAPHAEAAKAALAAAGLR